MNNRSFSQTSKSQSIGKASNGALWLQRSAKLWFAATAIGQLLFILFIIAFYYRSTLSGNFAAWDSKPIIEGYLAGDTIGNLAFAAHVLLAAIMITTGLLQLVPAVRTRWPKLHRLSGRTFVTTALLLAVGGLWLVWVRGTYMNLVGAFGITLNAMLIIWFAIKAWTSAVQQQFAIHRQWALRLFVVANAVWYMRVGYMVWGISTGGAGIGDAMDGLFDYFLAFANSLLPLAIMECYIRVSSSKSNNARLSLSIILIVAAIVTLGGSLAAWFVMWSPYIKF